MIQTVKDEVTINYNKLHADPKQGKSLDIILKKMKHRVVENMSSTTADALGLSRAILCNGKWITKFFKCKILLKICIDCFYADSLVKKMEELEGNEYMYKGLMEHCKHMLKAFIDMCHIYKGRKL